MVQGKQIGRIEQKWGFGLAPVKPAVHESRREAAVTVVATLEKGRVAALGRLEHLSVIKGLFSRAAKRDQWDWFTVWCQLGYPSRRDVRHIPGEITVLRRAIGETDERGTRQAVMALQRRGLSSTLKAFIDGRDTRKPDHGFIYVMSTRENPRLLKIGFTDRDVATRAREINEATGVIVPYGPHAAWLVPDARGVEADIHKKLAQYRIRDDREFFHADFSVAVSLIDDHVSQLSSPPP
ncbi:GIY-YIG nuclease family protein [Streptomyces sp. NRRL F-2890]|uniref:GIY-YIG nuclease family protein n=1 Tax=Streptomyces sp. NRRL F-2890 TaxID=1463845 RepID=UPI0004C71E64|nr:GIY-YIG nuclease family protein [Streptomyces sp. NRRL F-2890]